MRLRRGQLHQRPSCLFTTLLAFAVIACGAPSALAQTPRLHLPTVDGIAPDRSYAVAALSATGRYVVVWSEATNLVSDDTARCGIRSCGDIFVLDRDVDADGIFDEAATTAIEMVSRASDGTPANGDSYAPTISADGRYVAFTSAASNLLPGDTGHLDVFVHDRQTHGTEIVSVSSTGETAAGGTDYYSAVISANGRVVAFRSGASNLVPGDTNGNCLSTPNCSDLFVHDRVTGATTRVNVSTNRAEADRQSYYPALSADGRFVAFSSDATTLVTGDGNGFQDVFVHDTWTGVTERVSVTSDGHEGNAPSFGQPRPAISSDGRLVVFASGASNLPSGPVHDRVTHQTARACVEQSGATSLCHDPSLSSDARWLAFGADHGLSRTVVVRDMRTGHSVTVGDGFAPTLSANGRFLAFNSWSGGSFIADLDQDADGLPDAWETEVGLDPRSPTGDDGASGDPDHDGSTNAQEYAGVTHPRGVFRRYLAEGATSAFFDTRLALMNPTDETAHVQVTYIRADGIAIPDLLEVPPRRPASVNPKLIPGLEAAEFSTTIESSVLIVADRTMTWGPDGYGAHAETSVGAPATTWYLAEGATHSGFDLFYLLQNPGLTETTVRVRYLRPSGAPLTKTYRLGPASRTNIWVNVEELPGLGPVLASTDVSAVIESLDGTPIIVERAMYLSNQGRMFNAGHESAGVPAPQNQWFMAEGATGDYFDLFVLIANPSDDAADVRVTYLLVDGQTFSRTLTAPPNSRSSIWVDHEQFDGINGLPLADVELSTTIESLNNVPVIVERALWWPGAFATWHEAHSSAGATQTGTMWSMAEGETGGSRGTETYILIANASPFAGQALVTLYFEDGTSTQRTYSLPANSRSNVAVGPDFGAVVNGTRFGAVIESLGTVPAQIVVERAMYWNAGGVAWAAGTNALATRLR